MPPASLDVLVATAAGVAFVHTLIGVDHTLPFVAIGRARGWTLRRTLAITLVCGLAHVLSSVVLGVVGTVVGATLTELAGIESNRGELAAWLLVGFGLAYATWAWVRHDREHRRPLEGLTFWALFLVFVLGPCEPLIPLIAVPALQLGAPSAALVGGVFGAVTLATMTVVVAAGHLGAERLPSLSVSHRHAHALAGLAVAGSGVAIRALGI